MIPARNVDRRIPRKPLLWLAAALLFTVPPMFASLSAWVPIVFLTTLVAKFWMEPRGYRVRVLPVKMAIAGAGVVAIVMTYGTLIGMEPGVSLIIVFMSLKILEAHTARELQVMIMMAWILCLCGLVLSQELGTALWLMATFSLLLVALVQFHQGLAAAKWSSVRVAVKILTQALPLIAFLFVAFPRISTGFRLQLSKSGMAASGFSGTLSPSSVASLASSSAIAFRAQFPDGNMPPVASMYWRGIVMRDCDGLEWRATETPAAVPRSAWGHADGSAIRQLITLEPHDGHWMFGLDSPVAPPPGTMLAPGNYLWSPQPIRSPRQYEVTSSGTETQKILQPRERALLLAVPRWISPAVRELTDSWRAPDRNPHAIAQRALQYFRSNGFRYSLSPGEYQANDLDEFLFRRRVGFCEHYAAAFATLTRLAGIPSRVVLGYLGGEYNDLGHFVVVRQSDAHAWCELWFPDTGWQRTDPTSVVAPDRLTLGASAFMQAAAANNGQGSRIGQKGFFFALMRRPVFNRIRLAWESLNYQWEAQVVSFDEDEQESIYAAILPDRGHIVSFVLRLLTAIAAILVAFVTWVAVRVRLRRDTVLRLYQQFCRKASSLGAVRYDWEGPADFGRRAAELIPEYSREIRAISAGYIALRYSATPPPDASSEFARRIGVFLGAPPASRS